jgi:hypothetical protein
MTAGPLLAIMGVAGTAAGIGLAVVRERIDRRADSRASIRAEKEQEARNSKPPRSTDSADSNQS